MTATEAPWTETLLITGGASGIGAATAQRMAGRMQVVIADQDAEAAGALARKIEAGGGRCFALGVDVADAEAVRQMARLVRDRVGPVHRLFNNAGAGSFCSVAEMTREHWDRMMAVHVKGTFLCTQALLPEMCERGRGVVVNMASDYSVRGMRDGAAYAAAKAAVFSLTKSLAVEFASQGVRFNAVGPGPIETPLLRRDMDDAAWEHHRTERAKLVPMGRLGQPEEVAAVVDFLLSDRSSHMTGQIVHPNGGQLSW